MGSKLINEQFFDLNRIFDHEIWIFHNYVINEIGMEPQKRRIMLNTISKPWTEDYYKFHLLTN